MSIESRSRQYGKVFDHWQIREFLGSGSGGKTAVFRLVRSDSDRGTSALKVVNLIEERGCLERLSDRRREEYEAVRDECSCSAEQEVWMMDDLRGNTNIVDYLDHTFVDWEDDTGFGRDLLIRMELLKDLRSELRSGRQFSEAEVLKVGRDICTALILCHRRNILHRDVKPENIFRNKDGNYKLGDFGVSRVLDACPGAVASTGIGTYEYWPAEQMTGRYDTRVDTYSLGLVLYELSNENRLPFAASAYTTSKEVSQRLSGADLPAPCNASPALAEVILKACAFDPEDRFPSAGAMLRALRQVSAGKAAQQSNISQEPDSGSRRERNANPGQYAENTEKKKRPAKWIAGILLLISVIAVGVICAMGISRENAAQIPDATKTDASLIMETDGIPTETEPEMSVAAIVETTQTEAAATEEESPAVTEPESVLVETEPSETAEPETVPPETEPSAADVQPIMRGVVNKRYSSLNIRSEPDLTAKLVGRYASGDEIEIWETTQTKGIQWGRTDRGWVCMSYVNRTDVTESVLYTGWIIYTEAVNVRSVPSLEGYIGTTLKRGESVNIYETTVSEGMIWGRTDFGWVSLAYVDMVPTTEDAVDVRVIAKSNTPIYNDPNMVTRTGSYNALTLVLIYEYADGRETTMARTERGWVKEESFLR